MLGLRGYRQANQLANRCRERGDTGFEREKLALQVGRKLVNLGVLAIGSGNQDRDLALCAGREPLTVKDGHPGGQSVHHGTQLGKGIRRG